jgi:hypothetical protein
VLLLIHLFGNTKKKKKKNTRRGSSSSSSQTVERRRRRRNDSSTRKTRPTSSFPSLRLSVCLSVCLSASLSLSRQRAETEKGAILLLFRVFIFFFFFFFFGLFSPALSFPLQKRKTSEYDEFTPGRTTAAAASAEERGTAAAATTFDDDDDSNSHSWSFSSSSVSVASNCELPPTAPTNFDSSTDDFSFLCSVCSDAGVGNAERAARESHVSVDVSGESQLGVVLADVRGVSRAVVERCEWGRRAREREVTGDREINRESIDRGIFGENDEY